MKHRSILTKTFIEPLLKIAQQNLAEDGYLQVMLFLNLKGKGVKTYGLQMPNNNLGRQQVLNQLRQELSANGETIQEALILMDTWYIDGKDAQDGLHTLPSQHPERQEAIAIVGRDARNAKTSMVMQPYTRDEDGQLVWDASGTRIYGQSSKEVSAPGLVDWLFVPPSVH